MLLGRRAGLRSRSGESSTNESTVKQLHGEDGKK